jgi:hypothetical protein
MDVTRNKMARERKETVIRDVNKKWMKLTTYALHKVGPEGWVVVKVDYDEESGKCSAVPVSAADYKSIAMEKAKKLIYSTWF